MHKTLKKNNLEYLEFFPGCLPLKMHNINEVITVPVSSDWLEV